MMRVLLVDDEQNAINVLENYINNYVKDISVVGIAQSKNEAIDLINRTDFDLLLLDIHLGDGTGFEVLDKIENKTFNLVFITAYDEHAIRAFKYAALDYLLKPINPQEFIDTIQRVKNSTKHLPTQQLEEASKQFENPNLENLVINSSNEIHFLKIKNIIRLESYKNYTDIFLLSGEKITASKTLKYFDELLNQSHFIRIHQKHLVNTKFISKFLKEDGGYVVLNNQDKLEVSRRKKETLLKLLLNS